MPIYEFRCEACGHLFEELCHLGTQPDKCPKCGVTEKISRRMSTFAAQSNGSEGTKSLGGGGGGHQCGSCHGGHCGSCH